MTVTYFDYYDDRPSLSASHNPIPLRCEAGAEVVQHTSSLSPETLEEDDDGDGPLPITLYGDEVNPESEFESISIPQPPLMNRSSPSNEQTVVPISIKLDQHSQFQSSSSIIQPPARLDTNEVNINIPIPRLLPQSPLPEPPIMTRGGVNMNRNSTSTGSVGSIDGFRKAVESLPSYFTKRCEIDDSSNAIISEGSSKKDYSEHSHSHFVQGMQGVWEGCRDEILRFG